MAENSDKEIEVEAIPIESDSDVVAHNQCNASSNLQTLTVVDRSQEGIPESSLDIELGRLAGTDAKRHGVQVVLQIAAAWAKENNNRFAILGNKNAMLADELAATREENASLKATNVERAKHLPLVSSALALGPVIITFGLDQLISKNWGVGVVAVLIGGCITFAAFWAQRKDRK